MYDMSIETRQQNDFQVIRLVSDMFMESDGNAVKQVIEEALRVGKKNFVFSVSIGSLTNRIAISRLLLWCKETIWRNEGKLLFLEKNTGEKSVFADICESLHIPMYQNSETDRVTTAKSAKGK